MELADPVPQRNSLDPSLSDWLSKPGTPLELDLGCARGSFLVPMAERFPERNFLGVERLSARVARTTKKIHRLQLENARILQGEILETLDSLLPENCATWLHLLFPDPWPKRRHAPRRTLQLSSFQSFARVLQTGGHFRFLTDSQPYFEDSLRVVKQLENWTLLPDDPVAQWPSTEFQSRFTAQGLPTFGWILRKN